MPQHAGPVCGGRIQVVVSEFAEDSMEEAEGQLIRLQEHLSDRLRQWLWLALGTVFVQISGPNRKPLRS